MFYKPISSSHTVHIHRVKYFYFPRNRNKFNTQIGRNDEKINNDGTVSIWCVGC
jgi:hypothetical protein